MEAQARQGLIILCAQHAQVCPANAKQSASRARSIDCSLYHLSNLHPHRTERLIVGAILKANCGLAMLAFSRRLVEKNRNLGQHSSLGRE